MRAYWAAIESARYDRSAGAFRLDMRSAIWVNERSPVNTATWVDLSVQSWRKFFVKRAGVLEKHSGSQKRQVWVELKSRAMWSEPIDGIKSTALLLLELLFIKEKLQKPRNLKKLLNSQSPAIKSRLKLANQARRWLWHLNWALRKRLQSLLGLTNSLEFGLFRCDNGCWWKVTSSPDLIYACN